MKLSLNWLNDLIDISGIAPQDIVQGLTLATCELEGFWETFAYLKNIQAVLVLSVEQHPNADRLRLCRVKSRQKEEELQIVCGAPNVRPGMFAALAPVGAKLPQFEDDQDQSGQNFLEIRKARIRNLDSFGMLCSVAELGLEPIIASQGNGIMDLGELSEGRERLLESKDLKVGTPLDELFPFRDFVFEVDNKSITHRPDLWSHFGFARELSAIFRRPLSFDPLNVNPRKIDSSLPVKDICIEEEAALAYYGLSVAGIRVGPSPLWMQARLFNIGQRPINNVVDASNYLMFEVGQPNHAFDARSLKTESISIALQNKKSGIDSFTALDEERRSISQESILIFDGPPSRKRLVALGGIIGGLSSRVQEDTSQLFLESATFPRANIRKTIAALGLRTDSAQRFEKGQDPAKAAPSLYRLAQLLMQSCPDLRIGKLHGRMTQKLKRNRIAVSLDFLQKRLGFAIRAAVAQDILERLGFSVQAKAVKKGRRSKGKSLAVPEDVQFRITVPTYRSQYDVSLAEDIVEELGRLYGYDNIEPQAPIVPLEPLRQNTRRQLLRKVRNHLAYSGSFTETYNYSFASPADNRLWSRQSIGLKNPVFESKSELRLSLLPGLLEQAASNQDRFIEVRLFESGRIYWHQVLSNGENRLQEEQRLALIYMPEQPCSRLKTLEERKDMLDCLLFLRRHLENLLEESLGPGLNCLLPTQRDQQDADTRDYLLFLHPSARLIFQSAEEPGLIGSLGILHPAFENRFGIKRPTLIADISFDRLFAAHSKTGRSLAYRSPSVYPSSHFEISLLLALNTGTHIPVDIIRSMNIKEIDSIRYLTEYQGPPLQADQKSVSYEIHCSRPDATLKGNELQDILDTIVARLKAAGFALRS